MKISPTGDALKSKKRTTQTPGIRCDMIYVKPAVDEESAHFRLPYSVLYIILY